MSTARAGFVGLACVVLQMFGCAAPLPSTSPPPPALIVQNLDGPPVALFINGLKLAEIACESPSFVLSGNVPGAPSLPWTVSIKTLDGEKGGDWTVDGGASVVAFVRGTGVMFEQLGDLNPGRGPQSPCPTLHFESPVPLGALGRYPGPDADRDDR